VKNPIQFKSNSLENQVILLMLKNFKEVRLVKYDSVIYIYLLVEDFCSLVVSRFGLERKLVGAEKEKFIYYT
jgi:hypothetical protein